MFYHNLSGLKEAEHLFAKIEFLNNGKISKKG